MMNAQPDGLTKWHRFVSEKDMQALAEALADDVLLRSPVLWKPKQGKATAILHISSVARVLEDFTYQRQFVGDNAVVLEFSARVGSLSVKGVDIFQFNAAGRPTDYKRSERRWRNNWHPQIVQKSEANCGAWQFHRFSLPVHTSRTGFVASF